MVEKEKFTQIVKEVQKDKEQFELLYTHIVNKVYFWCYNLIGNEADAKDLTQESMIQIYTTIHSLRNPEMFNSWMYRLVRNCCLNHIRIHKKKDLEFLHKDTYNENFESSIREERRYNLPKELYDLEETKKIIAKFINNLPRRQKEVIVLYYLEEYKIEEIADILDYNVGSVKSRLHSGRKNLELQIKKYQEENNIKLYSLSLIPLLGLILNEYQSELCRKQNLNYDKHIYHESQKVSRSHLKKILSSKVFILFAVVILGASVVFGVRYWNQDQNVQGDELNNSTATNEFMHNKIKENPYVKDITYLDFPTRTVVDVTIKLKKDISKSNIKILFADEKITFEKNKEEIFVQVKENGIYTIVIDGKKTAFEIKQIQPFAPEVEGLWNYGDYLTLSINDELEQIDFEKSFVEYQNKEYKIKDDLKIYGIFKKEVKVVIFDKENHYKEYIINID